MVFDGVWGPQMASGGLERPLLSSGELDQVLRYMPHEHYTAHHDFFDPGEYAGRDREGGYATNRFATVFFYLNEVAAGGETGFPRAGKLSQPRDFLDCTRGLAVKPKRLAVLIFYSMLPNGEARPPPSQTIATSLASDSVAGAALARAV